MSKKFINIGLIFSEFAGQNNRFIDLLDQIIKYFSYSEIFIPMDSKVTNGRTSQVSYEAHDDYIKNIENKLKALLEKDLDLVISIGGDGIASYISNYLINNRKEVPILGIPAGTSNRGRILTSHKSELFTSKLSTKRIPGIKAVINDNVYWAFHDFIVGHSIIGMINDEVEIISIEELIKNKKREKYINNESIVTDKFKVKVNNKEVQHRITPKQIIFSPTNGFDFKGKAITGTFCFNDTNKLYGSLVLSESIIVKPSMMSDEIEKFNSLDQLVFGDREVVTLEGISQDSYLIGDGNPYIKVNGYANFSYVENTVEIAYFE